VDERCAESIAARRRGIGSHRREVVCRRRHRSNSRRRPMTVGPTRARHEHTRTSRDQQQSAP
jgi:hypothetical protein